MLRLMSDWRFTEPPELAAFEAIAQKTFAALPAHFRAQCGNVVIHVAEEAEPEILEEFGLSDPLELSGLFEGVDQINDSDMAPYALPNHVHLYRRAIIAEWRERRDVPLEKLVTHVLVHELGHHFGFSDEDMHAIEERDW